MVLDRIHHYRDKYKRFISEDPSYNELYKWEALKNFQDNWDINASDIEAMYEKSLYSETTTNLWASQFFYPKSAMLLFIQKDPEKVRSMFKELFNEELDIEKRMDHFVFHCDQLRDEIIKTHTNFQNHFHDGFRILSVYLCFRYPEKYTIYKYTEFKKMMEILGASSIPGTNEIGRFFKVMRTLYNKLAEDQELLAIHKRLRQDHKYYHDESLLLAQDFYWVCIRYKNFDKY
jgi:uncharacterized protein (UPF0332 family)